MKVHDTDLIWLKYTTDEMALRNVTNSILLGGGIYLGNQKM